MLACVVGQVFSAILFIVVHLTFYCLMFVSGCWLHSCKLNQNNKTNLRWYKKILSDKAFELFSAQIPAEEEVNAETGNGAVVGELFLESIPQMFLVLANGYLMKDITLVEYVTMCGSAAIIIKYLFKFGYWTLWMGVSLSNIPLSGRPKVKACFDKILRADDDRPGGGGDGGGRDAGAEAVEATSTSDIEMQNIDDHQLVSRGSVTLSESLASIRDLRERGIISQAEFNNLALKITNEAGAESCARI